MNVLQHFKNFYFRGNKTLVSFRVPMGSFVINWVINHDASHSSVRIVAEGALPMLRNYI
jgi:hypothetical protein